MTTSDEVRITIKQVWETQQDQGQALNDISSKLDRLLDSHERVDERVSDHEIRIRLVEQKVWAYPSAAFLMATASFIWQIINK